MELVDWDLAATTARRLIRPGPALTPTQALNVVRELRNLADEAFGHVTSYTGMQPAPGLRTTTEVIDRPTWATYNVAGMRTTLAPVLERLAEKRAARDRRTKEAASAPRRAVAGALSGAGTAAGRAVTGAELGSVLSFLASRVLGQYETFLRAQDGDGRLLLVAPNIVDTERRLGAVPRDFRMWVCLHEQTHHVQFTAAPWLKDHIGGLVTALAEGSDLDPHVLVQRVRAAVRDRKNGEEPPEGGPLMLLQSPQQRAVMTQIQAVMTLLEGHADQVMDAVGPQVVPTVADIRARFEARRQAGKSPIDRVLRKLLGIDAKLAQYRVGGAFCRAVTQSGGVDAMRVAFAGPEYLPTMAELRAPQTWLTRTADVRA